MLSPKGFYGLTNTTENYVQNTEKLEGIGGENVGLNIAGGDMYPWCDYTWNPVGGKCPNDCGYCYMKDIQAPAVRKKYSGPQRIIEKEMSVDLKDKNLHRREQLEFADGSPMIFVCSGNDIGVAPRKVQIRVMEKCREAPENWYLFQSKDPGKFADVEDEFPPKTIIGTTIETNYARLCRDVSNAPDPLERALSMMEFEEYRRMVSIEPKMACDPQEFTQLITLVMPDFVSIGADSKGHGLTEPTENEIRELIENLKQITRIRKKSNLDRLLS